ncbi:hypothetical protein B4U79_02582 [Dinothrombium tinctorium]|uniref:Uncharacterized protein n=1 Tax=Dinothrombium tinctorium TaxID=1965070 RepID=A0A3S3P4Z9_9ACAR|nr:hypothetical protein B4U79_15305 [Dinothrombium tinctorium]RWS01192.1 hypothetical protein B4U79_02582 [Dinothrombium tinctorium]
MQVSRKEKCDLYHKLSLYPSLYGFQHCDLYQANDQVEAFAACNSSSFVKTALFFKHLKYGQVECVKGLKTNFSCHVRTDLFSVCGCTTNVRSRKVFSFSIYGDNNDYNCGVLRQVRLAKVFFPGWSSRVYVNASVPERIIKMLQYEAEVEIIPSNSQFVNAGSMWRFFVADDENVDIYCTRDADSVLTYREYRAVMQWLESGKGFHSIRDHPWHAYRILAGLWCGRKRIKNIKNMMLAHNKLREKSDDQNFLAYKIWPLVKDDILVHESFFSHHREASGGQMIEFPVERIGCEFSGVAFRRDWGDITKPQWKLYQAV